MGLFGVENDGDKGIFPRRASYAVMMAWKRAWATSDGTEGSALSGWYIRTRSRSELENQYVSKGESTQTHISLLHHSGLQNEEDGKSDEEWDSEFGDKGNLLLEWMWKVVSR